MPIDPAILRQLLGPAAHELTIVSIAPLVLGHVSPAMIAFQIEMTHADLTEPFHMLLRMPSLDSCEALAYQLMGTVEHARNTTY